MAETPHAILHRIQNAKDKRPKWHRPYIRYVRGSTLTIDQTLCKGCGEIIAGLIPHDRFPDRMVYVALAQYQLVRIELDDGSVHETPVCKSCSVNLDQHDLESIYCADMAQFAYEESHGGGSPPWHAMGKRSPVKVRR